MSRSQKLFRAIVIMGASITAPACDDSKCASCQPVDAKVAASDAGIDANESVTDAEVDAVLIL